MTHQSLAARAEIVARSASWAADISGALRVLERWPQVADFDLATAIASGHLDGVRRLIAADPPAATRPIGALQREPLLYLAYSRLPGQARHCMEIASLLLDHGADPKAAFDDGWGNPFTVLTGAIGEGEGCQPPHAWASDLVTLLIAYGADPFDSQALYNTSVTRDDVTWLDVLWDHSVRRGRNDAWVTVRPAAIGGKLNLPPVDYLLVNAVTFGHHRRAQWLLAHGAQAATMHAYAKKPVRDIAMLNGDDAMVELLERHGVPASPPPADVAFRRAVMALDRDAARAIASSEPPLLKDGSALFLAAAHDRTDAIELLLDLGMDVDVMDEGESRALHAAAGAGALEAVKLLVARGANIDRPTKHYGGALGAAAFRNQRAVAKFLAPLSRDINPITFFGLYGRLEALLAEEPALVNAVHVRTGNTPLFTLPQDDEESVRMAKFLLARGADAGHRNFQQQSADQFLRSRGLLDAAAVVEAWRETETR